MQSRALRVRLCTLLCSLRIPMAMKFTRSGYPSPDPGFGYPCWRLETRLFVIDVDWNVRGRIPVGMCCAVSDPAPPPGSDALLRWSVCLDVNPPLGEPNRLYVNVGARAGWSVVLGLPSLRWMEWPEENGGCVTWRRRLHIDGCDRYRYRYEQDAWHRNSRPEPLHWGWLTIRRRRLTR